MSLDWSNERYLRLYRPSVDHRTLCWQARVIWPLIMQEADGAGVIGARRGVAAIAVFSEAALRLASARVVCTSITANSSPPMRPAMSLSRI